MPCICHAEQTHAELERLQKRGWYGKESMECFSTWVLWDTPSTIKKFIRKAICAEKSHTSTNSIKKLREYIVFNRTLTPVASSRYESKACALGFGFLRKILSSPSKSR